MGVFQAAVVDIVLSKGTVQRQSFAIILGAVVIGIQPEGAVCGGGGDGIGQTGCAIIWVGGVQIRIGDSGCCGFIQCDTDISGHGRRIIDAGGGDGDGGGQPGLIISIGGGHADRPIRPTNVIPCLGKGQLF